MSKAMCVGDKVQYKIGRGWANGHVVDIYEDDGTVVIQTPNGRKVLRTPDKVRPAEDAPDDLPKVGI